MTPLLELKDIHFSHKETDEELLRGASLSLEPGDRLALRGDNGSGKSTLLHIATGLLAQSSGEVRYFGERCAGEADFVTARKNVGYLLQHSEDQLFCPTVLEDVAFGPYNQGFSLERAREMSLQTLERLGIAHLADKNGSLLSGGEQKLAALATLLVLPIKMLFLDEPTNNLDKKSRQLVTDIILRSNLPCIVVTHDAEFQHNICTCYLTLESGILAAE